MTTKKATMYKNIKKHGENLNKIFKTDYDNIALCKKLRRLEVKAHQLATDHCNGDIDQQDFDIESYEILKKVGKLLDLMSNGAPIYPLFFNGDARGYALKIDDEYIREHNIDIYRDWGGYGILAPDFSE